MTNTKQASEDGEMVFGPSSRSYAQPGDRAEMPNGEVGTVIQVLGTMKRRNGREVTMLQVETATGLRIWASDDLASLARDLPSKVNPVEGDVVATTEAYSSEREMDAALQRGLGRAGPQEVNVTRRTNYPYAWRYGWRWVLTSRTIWTALRCFYWTYIRGWDGEACWFCGRPYPLWWAPDDLWAEFSGNSGLCCPSCFDAQARRAGVWLRWRPERA